MQEENKKETQQKWQNFLLTDQDEEMTQIIKIWKQWVLDSKETPFPQILAVKQKPAFLTDL